MMTTNPASNFSTTLLARLHALGVEDIVVAPGSRSESLALAAARLEKEGRIRLHVRVDERSAAFFALGLALESGKPAPVIVTSGTAVTNLLPATTEAHHSSVPMMLLTADRPAYQHGVGVGQTTQQAGIMPHLFRGQHTAAIAENHSHDAITIADTLWTQSTNPSYPGPVQLNISFEEPLSGDSGIGNWEEFLSEIRPETPISIDDYPDVVFKSPAWEDVFEVEPRAVNIRADAQTVVIAGHGAGDIASAVADALDAPLIAEIHSGAHFGPNLIVHYRDLLKNRDFAEQIRRAIVFGVPSLSRELPEFIAQVPEVITVTTHLPELFNPSGRPIVLANKVTVEEADEAAYLQASELVEVWRQADRQVGEILEEPIPAPNLELANNPNYRAQAEFIRQELAADRRVLDNVSLVRNVWQASWPHDRLFLAASLLIRDMDHHAPGRNIRVFTNRGVAGIDGTIATGLGIARAKPQTEPGITRILLGDLAFLHDIGSLFLNPSESIPAVQIIVGNNGGGGIFDQIEVAKSADWDDYNRSVFVEHAQTFEQIVTGFGHRYVHVSGEGEFMRTLTAPTPGITVIEVPLERSAGLE